MTFDDTPVPDNDPVAFAARHALGDLAELAPTPAFSWDAVQHRARRAQRRRLATLGAACAIVLLGGGAAVAAVAHREGSHVRVAGGGTTTTPSTASTTTSTPGIENSSSAPHITTGDTGSLPLTSEPATDTTTIGPGTDQVILQPENGSWDAKNVSVDKSVVTAGEDFVVSVDLTNTGTELQTTTGYASFGIGCVAYPFTDSRDGLPTGQFFTENPVMQPGETRTFSITFHAEPTWVGSLRCGSSYASHGDAFATFGFPAVEVEVVAAPTSSTTTTSTSTTTTIP